MPTGDDSMHEKRERTEGCRPGLREERDGQQTARARSVGACASAIRAGLRKIERGCRGGRALEVAPSSLSRRGARHGHAASQALGLGCMRARRVDSGVGVDIRVDTLGAGRSVDGMARSSAGRGSSVRKNLL